MKRFLCTIALALGSTFSAAPQQLHSYTPAGQTHAEVLVLGVYHMDNPGRDIFNTKADDVLAPKRQAEIGQVVETLKKFRPTKIAVESEAGTDRMPKLYAEYLAGKHELTRDEREQLGFRLAKELGHKTIYPVDADADFPYQRLTNYAKGTGRANELESINTDLGAMVKAKNEYLATHTVLETLLYMNADQEVAEDVGCYFRQAAIGEPEDWAGADLVAEWFRRNIRIYSNVVRLADSPSERILVIFGAGHLGWLRHDFASNPSLHLRKLSEFAN